ncbi:MAG: patatin-like phospholipase family protein, partial [Vicinamibacteria bacterium]
LMGGALAALSVLPKGPADRLLATLCATFIGVDTRIALTKTLKEAARQLGVRARNVDLSPARLRRLIRRGSRSDPGYAAVGAPPALVDAISELFLIPHEGTRTIAAQFVAGRIPQATHDFLEQLRVSTLGRLEITHAMMGTSLLEPTARQLLGEGFGIALDRAQPYHRRATATAGEAGDFRPLDVSFFCTTSHLNSQTPLLLGRDFFREFATYDFVKAALASSAFPAVFSPVQEADVLPGLGRTDSLLSDGGMFDNLPFFPAMEVLADVQRARLEATASNARAELQGRYDAPDLFVAAALNADPSEEEDESPDFLHVAERVSSLAANVKLDAFVTAAKKVDQQVAALLAATSAGHTTLDTPLANAIVSAAILKISPTSKEQVNPTFSFCASLGLRPARVQRSIADGCFRTLESFMEAARAPGSALSRSISALQRLGRIPTIRARPFAGRPSGAGPACPYFLVDEKDHPCPFVSGETEIGRICKEEQAHQDAWRSWTPTTVGTPQEET